MYAFRVVLQRSLSECMTTSSFRVGFGQGMVLGILVTEIGTFTLLGDSLPMRLHKGLIVAMVKRTCSLLPPVHPYSSYS